MKLKARLKYTTEGIANTTIYDGDALDLEQLDIHGAIATVDEEVSGDITKANTDSEIIEIANDVLDSIEDAQETVETDSSVIDGLDRTNTIPAQETIVLLHANQKRLIKNYHHFLTDEFKGTKQSKGVMNFSVEAHKANSYDKMDSISKLRHVYAIEKKNLLDKGKEAFAFIVKIISNLINGVINLIDIQGRRINSLKSVVKKIKQGDYKDTRTFNDTTISRGLIKNTTPKLEWYSFPEFKNKTSKLAENLSKICDYAINDVKEITSFMSEVDKIRNDTNGRTTFSLRMAQTLAGKDDPIARLLGISGGQRLCGIQLDVDDIDSVYLGKDPLIDNHEFEVMSYRELTQTLNDAEKNNIAIKNARSKLGTLNAMNVKATAVVADKMSDGTSRKEISEIAGCLRQTLNRQKVLLRAVIDANNFILKYVAKSMSVATQKD